MGNGGQLDSNISVSSETFRGKFIVNNPNFKNSDKSIYTSLRL